MNTQKTPPLIKSSLKGKKPPKKGRGIRVAIYQGGGLVGNKVAIKHNLNNLKNWAKMASGHKAQIIVLHSWRFSGKSLIFGVQLSNISSDNVTFPHHFSRL